MEMLFKVMLIVLVGLLGCVVGKIISKEEEEYKRIKEKLERI